jgi:YD repeat-containing protein
MPPEHIITLIRWNFQHYTRIREMRIQRSLPNRVTTTYCYDDTSRLLSLVHSDTSSFNYTYDGVGNRLSMTTSTGTHSYAYDYIYQLINGIHPTSATEAFTYDGVGNRLSSAESPNWTYSADNQLTGFDGTAYTYDNNGNMITKTDASGTTTYTYNSDNQLVRIDLSGGGFAEYVYDALGRRIEKNVNGTITRYVYDGEDILFEYDGLNTIIARYTHGPGVDEPLIMERGGASYYYHADGLGSITEVTDASGAVVASYTYLKKRGTFVQKLLDFP